MLRVSLKSKAAIIVVLVFMGMMALIATVQTRFIRSDLLKDIGSAQSALVQRAALELDQKIETALLALTREAAAIQDDTLVRPEQLQPYLEQQPTLLLLFDGLFIFSPTGQVIAAVPDTPGIRSTSVQGREYYERSIALRAPLISLPYTGRVSQRPFVAMTAPIMDSKGRLVGFLAGYLDLLQANFLGGLASTSIGTSGRFFVISRGDPSLYLVHPDPQLVLKPSTTGVQGEANLRAIQGFEGTLEATDARGGTDLVSYKALTRTGWILGATYPAVEAFAPVAAAEHRLWMISGLLAILLAPLIWFLTSLLISPLLRLSSDVHRLRASSGGISAKLINRPDEIGELARAFNALVQEQQQTVEALRRSRQLLDNIVENIPAAVQLKDVTDDLRIVMWNRAAEQMFGIAKEQAIGSITHGNWSAVEAAEYREADLRAIAENGQEFSHRAITNARGEKLIAHVRKVPLRDDTTTTHLLVIMDDITERVTAEEELHSNRAFLKSLIDNAPVGIYVKDMRPGTYGTMVVWNKHADEITGMRGEDVIGRKDRDILREDVYREIQSRDREMLANPVVQERTEDPFRRPDGNLIFLHTISVPLLGTGGTPEFILRISEDMTARRRQQKDLRARTAELMTVSDASPLGMFRADARGHYTYANRSYQMITGSQLTGEPTAMAEEHLHPDDRAAVLRQWQEAIAAKEPFSSVHRYRHPDGQLVWASIKVAPVFVDGNVVGYVGSADDITARREAQHALQVSEHRLRTITDTMPACVAYVDRNETYQFTNAAFERMFGLSREELRGRTIRSVVSEALYAQLKPFIDQVFRGEAVTFERERTSVDGLRWIESTYIPEFSDEGGEVVGFHAMLQDTTASKREEERLLRLAQLDTLTGLANRVGFEQRLTDAMAASRASGEPLAVMYVDIDRFKSINDNHGHAVGDALLIGFSRRLRTLLRKTDIIARLGGDEFVVVMEHVIAPDIAAKLAMKTLDETRQPFIVTDLNIEVDITCSMGIAFYAGSAVTAVQLLAEADAMLYTAKNSGRNQFRVGPWPVARSGA